ncbi:MAG: hypothetical protein KC501_24730 [Myxococcales bacterium]|nr:hypothetical protein [Myxococcales bacterium]
MLGAAAGVTTLDGCDGESGICGPCGSIATGQLSISGDARLDGFFAALADLQAATGSISANFDANILALAEVYGIATADVTVDAAFVDQLVATIRADLMANISGGISIEYVPPSCSASVNVAVEAQASCEANAGCECDVQVDPGQVAVQCEGQCSGGCSAECTGQVECRAPEAGIACSGSCEGSCELDVAAECSGTCRGMCMGNCSLQNADGECEGSCDGMCQGTCEVSGGASCSGTCHGTCVADVDPGGCEGEVGCRGSCSGECSGSCEGSFTPPSASAECECEASADCEAQASAQAEANIQCSPPSFDLVYELNASLDASGEASFLARLGELRVRGAAILQGFAQARALIDGQVNGEVVFNPAPFARIQGEFQALVSAGLSGEFNIAPGRIDCVLPAIQEAVSIVGEIGGEFTASIQAQASFTAFLLQPL